MTNAQAMVKRSPNMRVLNQSESDVDVRSTSNVGGDSSLPVLHWSPTNEEPCGQVDATLAAILVELGEDWRAPLPPNPTPADEVGAWIEDARRMHEAACVVRLRRELRR